MHEQEGIRWDIRLRVKAEDLANEVSDPKRKQPRLALD